MIVPEPHRNPTLLGHDAAIEQIVATYQSSRMPQAWLIHGIAGIGKATLAYHIANYVMSDGRNLPGKLNAEHPVARLISAEAHPDLFVLQRPIDDKTGERKDSIAVEDARKIAPISASYRYARRLARCDHRRSAYAQSPRTERYPQSH